VVVVEEEVVMRGVVVGRVGEMVGAEEEVVEE
jgi:hypothetical protein